jgi:antitoxin HicB
MKEQHLGSDFDDFLAEEGLLAEAEIVAVKRVIAYQVSQLMVEQNLSKSEMAKMMSTSRASLDRLLDPENQSVTLQTLEKAANALGKRLQIAIV